ncbi:MAG: EAL domain-containing protein [Xanthomonadaceae bacterium]|nr:EAL domain-containing protein [Xanthomonadaceae bacterium]
MMPIRLGLQARFMLAMLATLLVVVALALALWQRQSQTFRELTQLSAESVHELTFDELARRGGAMAAQLADRLVNPIYYLDLDRIGEFAAATRSQPDVAYVLVYDPQGRIIHDGTRNIVSYGEPVVGLPAPDPETDSAALIQWGSGVMDATHAVVLGDERIGGVRIGFSLKALQAQQARAQAQLAQRQEQATYTYRLWLAGLLGLLLILASGLSLLVSRGMVGPIRMLAEAARHVEAGRYRQIALESGRRDEMGALIRAFSRMSDSVERHERDVRRMAYTDALTGLPNRLALRELLDLKLIHQHADGQGLALLFIDLDDFKRVNDTLGHEAGDRVLVRVAERIRDSARLIADGNVQVARFGGDEFVAVVESEEPRLRAARVADAVIEALLEPVHVGGRDLFLGSSIGITVFPDDAGSTSQLIKNGDIAMYQAKLSGKACYRFYSRVMDDAMADRVQLEHDLRGALERHELRLYYQPVVSTHDGSLHGMEALLRWEHPQRGLIMPAAFVEVAEQCGLITPIGAYALEQACRDTMAIAAACPSAANLFVSVNVSARQLRSGDLVEVVSHAIARTGLPASRLRVELTETALLGDEVLAGALLSRLRGIGVRVWLDDFGTGFSGLSHLRRVPVDGVKIDRSFVADLLDDPDDLALTTAIIALAHSLGIGVVAEGVEDVEQLRVLARHGCDLAQGFLVARPMPASVLIDWVQRRPVLVA